MHDDETPSPGAPSPPKTSTDFSMAQIIDKVRARADHLLAREARIGTSTPNRIVQEGAASTVKPDRITPDEAIGRHFRLLDHLQKSQGPLDAARQLLAEKLNFPEPQIVQLLEGDEILALYTSDNSVVLTECEVAEILTALACLSSYNRRSEYEVKRILSGHFREAPKPGRPAIRRGMELCAELMGYAEGFGLPATGDRLLGGIGTAFHAVITAVSRMDPPSDPVSKAVFDQLPTTQSAFENLSRQCGKDEYLRSRREAGRQLSEREIADEGDPMN